MAKIYWLHGQPGSGKTTIGKRLQIWLQTDKANWRKTVFHIDESDIQKMYGSKNELETVLIVSKFLVSTNHDVVVSVTTPAKKFRNKLKEDGKGIEIYCHTRNKIGKEKELILDYELPDHTFVDLDTTGEVDNNFEKLIKMLL
jgi:adenylylsulfate kinase-like enzyme